MSDTVLKVENLSKLYRLGEVGTGTISHDLNRWWARVRGKENPFSIIGEENDRTSKGNSDYVWSLKDVSFNVAQGEVLGILGRNGAGKSTLLKLLSKVTRPTTGTVKIKGRIASLLEVGTGFHPDLTGRENVFLNGAILGMTKKEIQKKFDEIVDFAGVERYIDTPVKRYSSGMYVRLAFAVAAYLESEILIVDEVLAVGDAEFQKKCLGKMGDISKGQGRTVFFVSHNLSSISALCTKCLMLENGKLIKSGSTSDIINAYVRRNLGKNEILGSSPIKRFWIETLDGTIVDNLFMGQPFKMKFDFEIEKDYPILFAGFGIENMLGQRVASLNNEMSGKVTAIKKGKYTAELIVENPNFLNGEYLVTISLVANSVEWVDLKEKIGLFEIVEKDVYGTGKLPSSEQGLVYVDGRVLIH